MQISEVGDERREEHALVREALPGEPAIQIDSRPLLRSLPIHRSEPLTEVVADSTPDALRDAAPS